MTPCDMCAVQSSAHKINQRETHRSGERPAIQRCVGPRVSDLGVHEHVVPLPLERLELPLAAQLGVAPLQLLDDFALEVPFETPVARTVTRRDQLRRMTKLTVRPPPMVLRTGPTLGASVGNLNHRLRRSATCHRYRSTCVGWDGDTHGFHGPPGGGTRTFWAPPLGPQRRGWLRWEGACWANGNGAQSRSASSRKNNQTALGIPA